MQYRQRLPVANCSSPNTWTLIFPRISPNNTLASKTLRECWRWIRKLKWLLPQNHCEPKNLINERIFTFLIFTTGKQNSLSIKSWHRGFACGATRTAISTVAPTFWAHWWLRVNLFTNPKSRTKVRLFSFLERFKKCCGRSERGFLGFGEALAKEQVWITLWLSRNDAQTQKDRFLYLFHRMATTFFNPL